MCASTASTVLLDGRTYQGFGGFWARGGRRRGRGPEGPAVRPVAERGGRKSSSRAHPPSPGGGTPASPATTRPGSSGGCARSKGGDIVVLASHGVIRRLLEAGELDRLSITLCPELIGAGARLFGDGPAGSSWALAEATPTSSGALCLRYDLIRPAAGR